MFINLKQIVKVFHCHKEICGVTKNKSARWLGVPSKELITNISEMKILQFCEKKEIPYEKSFTTKVSFLQMLSSNYGKKQVVSSEMKGYL